MKKRIWTVILTLIFAIGLIVSIYQIAGQLREYKEGDDSYTDLESYVDIPENHADPTAPEDIPTESGENAPEESQVQWPTVDFVALSEINPDIVGWIYIEDTEISYPVVQGSDNQYYLKHLFSGEYNSSGCIFLDSRVSADFSDRHSILYGHHMKNGTMFSGLDKYKVQEYYDAHSLALLMTPGGNYEVEFFAGYVASVEDVAWDVGFGSDAEFEAWLESARERSWFESDVSVAVTDRILTLSTCSYEFDNARFVLLGVLQKAE